MITTKLSKEALQKLRKELPHGSIGKIAKAVGIHRNAVRDVFAGEYSNEKVIETAKEIIKQYKAAIKAGDQEVNSIVEA